jgi:hypothetical protein
MREEKVAVVEQLPSGPVLQDSVAPQLLIRNGAAIIEVDSIDVAIAAVRAAAQRVGGYVTNVAVQSGEQHVREATLTLRVPATRFDEALSGLEPIGDVESVNVSAEDVGEEYVDVEARIANSRRLEERLVDLLARRTGALEDVLAVERELARVREQMERLEGRLRYLRNRINLSTLTVTVHEPRPLMAESVGQPGRNIDRIARRDPADRGRVVGWLAALASSSPAPQHRPLDADAGTGGERVATSCLRPTVQVGPVRGG